MQREWIVFKIYDNVPFVQKACVWGHIWRGCFQNVQMIVREDTLLLFPQVGTGPILKDH
jgi:hypothetical protein